MNYGHRKKSDTSSIAEVCGLSAGFGFQEIHKLLLLCMCAFRFSTSLRTSTLFGWTPRLVMYEVPM